jgi:hypothetical protein
MAKNGCEIADAGADMHRMLAALRPGIGDQQGMQPGLAVLRFRSGMMPTSTSS